MKFGIISDIHGNIEALNVVINKLEKNVDKIICLGDFVCGANHSEEVVQRIISMKEKVIAVRGNHEGYVLNGMPKFVHDHKRPARQNEFDRTEWVKRQLSDSSKEFLQNLPKERYYEVEGKKIYISHYPMKQDGKFKKHVKNANVGENEEMFDGIDADIFLYGHTHLEVFNVKDNKAYINPGSLGCPWKDKNAPYGVLSIEDNCVNYEQFYASYDVKSVVEEIKRVKFPGYEGVLKVFYGEE